MIMMKNKKIATKCVQGGYTPGNGEPRQVPIIQIQTECCRYWKYIQTLPLLAPIWEVGLFGMMQRKNLQGIKIFMLILAHALRL